jgi:hypothetical protein
MHPEEPRFVCQSSVHCLPFDGKTILTLFAKRIDNTSVQAGSHRSVFQNIFRVFIGGLRFQETGDYVILIIGKDLQPDAWFAAVITRHVLPIPHYTIAEIGSNIVTQHPETPGTSVCEL